MSFLAESPVAPGGGSLSQGPAASAAACERFPRVRSAAERAGYFAIGLIYVAMGFVSARIAFLGARDRDHGVLGALRFLLDRPHGAWVLGAVVAGPRGDRRRALVAVAAGPAAAPSSGSVCSSTASATRRSPGRRHGCSSTCAAVRTRRAARSSARASHGCCPSHWGAAAARARRSGRRRWAGSWEIGQGLGLSGRLPFRRGRCCRAARETAHGDLAVRPRREGRDARGSRLLPHPRGRGAGSFGACGRSAAFSTRSPHTPLGPALHGRDRGGAGGVRRLHGRGSRWLRGRGSLRRAHVRPSHCRRVFGRPSPRTAGRGWTGRRRCSPCRGPSRATALTPERAARGAAAARTSFGGFAEPAAARRRRGAIRVEPAVQRRREELAGAHRDVEAQQVLGRRVAAAGGAAARRAARRCWCAARTSRFSFSSSRV